MKKLKELGISPTPWSVIDGDVINSDNVGVVYSYDSSYLKKEDARLIAAAPELYEALRMVIEPYDPNKNRIMLLQEVLEIAQKALAKAAGEEVGE